MANPNAPFGLKPTRSLVSGEGNFQLNQYVHSASDGTALYIGDAVVTNHTSTSGNVPFSDGTPIVTLVSDNSAAGTTADLRGACTSFRANGSNLTLNYCPASTLLEVQVCDDPFALFAVQSDGTVTSSTPGASAKYVNGSGSTTTGISGGVLHQSTLGQSHYTLHIIRVLPIVGQTNLAANAIVEVKINNHELLDTSGDV